MQFIIFPELPLSLFLLVCIVHFELFSIWLLKILYLFFIIVLFVTVFLGTSWKPELYICFCVSRLESKTAYSQLLAIVDCLNNFYFSS